MERISLLTLVLLAPIFSTFILALQHPSRDHDIDFETEGSKPVAFLLAGDSTTAKNGGWGDGFLTFVEKPAIGRNHGRGGATTVSFKKGGNWGNVMTDVKKYAAQYLVYVTIQVRSPRR
jgi:hypothetical protein